MAVRYAEEAGNHARAGELLLESARRALEVGALGSVEAALTRARGKASVRRDLLIDIDRLLVGVLSSAGKVDDVYRVGSELLDVLRAHGASDVDRAAVLLDIATAATAAGH
jgi:hypothetical protein